MVKDNLADAHGFWGDFYVFVSLDVLQGFFEGKLHGGDDVGFLVGA